jgi:hypothetical protein
MLTLNQCDYLGYINIKTNVTWHETIDIDNHGNVL